MKGNSEKYNPQGFTDVRRFEPAVQGYKLALEV